MSSVYHIGEFHIYHMVCLYNCKTDAGNIDIHYQGLLSAACWKLIFIIRFYKVLAFCHNATIDLLTQEKTEYSVLKWKVHLLPRTKVNCINKIADELHSENSYIWLHPLKNVFFPWEWPSEFFSLEKGLQFFSIDFLRPPTQIINGRPVIFQCWQTILPVIKWINTR